MEHNWFWLVKSRIWKGFRVKGHRSPPPHTIDFIECRDETTVSIVRSWPSNYRMCTRIPFINQSSIHANCLLTAKCVRSRSWLQETGQNRALAIWCRLGTGTTFKTQNWSIFLLDQAQKKKKNRKTRSEPNQLCRDQAEMPKHSANGSSFCIYQRHRWGGKSPRLAWWRHKLLFQWEILLHSGAKSTQCGLCPSLILRL